MVSTTDEQIDRNYQLNFLNYPKKRKQWFLIEKD
jgi:hypothetical protein